MNSEERQKMLAEIARLQEAKRRALAIADERGKESNALRQENGRLRAVLHDIIALDHHYHGPESRATKLARAALTAEQTAREK